MPLVESRLFIYVIIILSAIVHEYAHAWAALRQGDPTAKYAGRLTLNPIPHIDLWGTIIIPLLMLFWVGAFFGYAKPVPINPYNFRDQKKGMVWVSLAGIGANFLIAITLGLVLRFYPTIYLAPFLQFIILVNIWLALFNLLPFPPLDGSKLVEALVDFKPAGAFSRFMQLASTPAGIIIAIVVAMIFLPTLSTFIYRLIVG